MERAPYFDEVADGPDSAEAWWLRTSDSVRIRVGFWPEDGEKGTVLLFPGRTEYVEKYGRAATEFARRGFAMLAIDWRGQGLADRLLPDRLSGHVLTFPDYQRDVAAVLAAAQERGLPKPYYLVAHSMGGCVGLRALIEGLDVNAACFSAPMWGIRLARNVMPLAVSLSWLSVQLGQSHRYAPGTKGEPYVNSEPFGSNALTTDEEMFGYMARQTEAHPDLRLGGPSMGWLHEALTETRALAALPAPPVSVVTFLGSDETIVDMPRIERRMARWPGGRLEMIEGARHEVMMETPEVRNRVFDTAAAHFAGHP